MVANLSGCVESTSTVEATLSINELRTMREVSLGQVNKNLDSDLWDGYHTTDNLKLSGKVTVGSNSINLRNSLSIYDDSAFNRGLEGHWTANYLPDCPDNGYETSYISDSTEFSSLTGWMFTDISTNLIDESLQLTLSGISSSVVIAKAFGTDKHLKIKSKRISGKQSSLKVSVYTGSWSILINEEYYSSDDWKIFDFVFSGNVTQIKIEFNSTATDWLTSTKYYVNDYIRNPLTGYFYVCLEEHTSGIFDDDLTLEYWELVSNIIDIGFIYTGTGKYTTKLINTSNYKVNGVVTGCTPVTGVVSGRYALRFNNSTDSVVFNKLIKSRSVTFWASTSTSESVVFSGYGDGSKTENGFILLNEKNGNGLQIGITTGIEKRVRSLPDFFILDGLYHFYAFTLSNTELKIYRDAILKKIWEEDFIDFYIPVNKLGFIAQTALYPYQGLYPHIGLLPNS